jgi:hypothetical protein
VRLAPDSKIPGKQCPLGNVSAAILAWTADAPSLALTGLSRDTLGHSGRLAIHRISDTARMRSSANAERDSLELSAVKIKCSLRRSLTY